MSESETIASRLKMLISAAGSQKSVARLAATSDGTLINWLRGLGMRDSKAREVASKLGVPLEWLLHGKGDSAAVLAEFKSRLNPQSVGPRERITQAREQRGLTILQLGKLIKRPPDYIRSLEEGRTRASESTIDALVKALPELSKSAMMEGSEHTTMLGETPATYGLTPSVAGVRGRTVPLLSMAEAGALGAGHTDEGWTGDGIFAMNVNDRKAFAVKVSGNSMEPIIVEGEYVICSPLTELTNGACAVVRTKSEQAFVKFWRLEGETAVLESANPGYEPIRLPIREIAGAWPVIQRISSGIIKQKAVVQTA